MVSKKQGGGQELNLGVLDEGSRSFWRYIGEAEGYVATSFAGGEKGSLPPLDRKAQLGDELSNEGEKSRATQGTCMAGSTEDPLACEA